MDLGSTAMGILTGLGAVAAGTGIFKAGIAVGRLADRVPAALEAQASMQTRLADVAERQAAAIEKWAAFIPLLDRLQESREEIGMTLRTMARKLNELLRLNGQEAEGP